MPLAFRMQLLMAAFAHGNQLPLRPIPYGKRKVRPLLQVLYVMDKLCGAVAARTLADLSAMLEKMPKWADLCRERAEAAARLKASTSS